MRHFVEGRYGNLPVDEDPMTFFRDNWGPKSYKLRGMLDAGYVDNECVPACVAAGSRAVIRKGGDSYGPEIQSDPNTAPPYAEVPS